jgi:uncharacterized membrane protein
MFRRVRSTSPGVAMYLFTRSGFWGAFRYLHVLAAVMWMGLLWFFNLIQTPAYAEMEPGARNNAFDKLTWRALWWFRYAALATLATGILVLLIGGFGDGDPYGKVFGHNFFGTAPGMMLAAAILFAFIMAYNVWMVIWPAQQIVIANARNVQAGGEANPAAPAAARRGAMASRQNTLFSLTVFLGMVGTSHFFGGYDIPNTLTKIVFYIILIAIAVLLEANALGQFGTAAGKPNTIIYDTHQNCIIAGAALAVFFWLFFEIVVTKAG